MLVVSDGQYIISCSSDGFIKVWDVQKTECIRTMRVDYAKKSSMNTLCLLNSHEFCVGTDNGEIFTFDWKNGRHVFTFKRYLGITSVWKLQLMNDKKSLIVCFENLGIQVIDTTTWTFKQRLYGHSEKSRSLLCLKNGCLVTGSYDASVKIWNSKLEYHEKSKLEGSLMTDELVGGGKKKGSMGSKLLTSEMPNKFKKHSKVT